MDDFAIIAALRVSKMGASESDLSRSTCEILRMKCLDAALVFGNWLLTHCCMHKIPHHAVSVTDTESLTSLPPRGSDAAENGVPHRADV